MRTIGVEEELMLVDAAGERSVPHGPAVIEQAAGGGDHPVEHEFKREQVEIGSDPVTDLRQLRSDLVALRARAAEAARARGATIAAIATSPWKLSPQSTPDERYLTMVEEFGLLAREQLTCGQHVHVSIESRAEGVAVLDRIRGWLPVLVALSANSPFWQGQDTGYSSFRSVLWGRWPSAGPVDVFGSEAAYDRAVAELITAGAALDEAMIYFDARLSSRYPTVEIRVADVCTEVEDAVLLAALARAMVETAAQRWRAGAPTPQAATGLLRAASWRAARWGMQRTLVDPRSGRPVPAWNLVDELVTLLRPALVSSGDVEVVCAAIRRLRQQGTGADRQRAAYAGSQSLAVVVRDAGRRTLGA